MEAMQRPAAAAASVGVDGVREGREGSSIMQQCGC